MLLGFTSWTRTAGGAWRGGFLEDAKRDKRCWEPGGQPGLPVCPGEPGREPEAAGMMACPLRKANRESRKESDPERTAHGPAGSTTSSSSCQEVFGGDLCPPRLTAPRDPSRAAHTSTHHTTQVPQGRSPREESGGSGRCQGLPFPARPRAALAGGPDPGVCSWGSQPQRLQLLRVARLNALS